MRPATGGPSNGDSSQRNAPVQDIKFHRHRDKLEMIRDSLKPFEAPFSPAVEQLQTPVTVESQHSMVNALCQAGHDRHQAILALKLVNYKSVTAAAEILLNINKEQRMMLPTTTSQMELQMNGNYYQPNGSAGPSMNSSMQTSSALSSSGYGSRMTSIQSHHPSVYPSTSTYQDDNEASVCVSPSTQIRSRSPHRTNINSVQHQPDFHRSHAHIQLRQSLPGEEAPRAGRPSESRRETTTSSGTTILIERAPSDPRIRFSGQMMHGNSPRRLASPREAIPVIKTRMDRPPSQSTKLHINVEPAQMESPRRNNYRADVTSDSTVGSSTVSGVSGGALTGVQNILVDPDQHPLTNPDFINYVDRLCLRHPVDMAEVPSTSSSTNMISNYVNRVSPHHTPREGESSSSPSVIRSVSPLPPSVEERVRNNNFESVVKSCKPRMFCFFMEQHVERILQQHSERVKRAEQLSKEMEAANLPEKMKDQMLSFLIQKESRYMRLKRQKMNKDMFDSIRHIGVGAFGRVTLVKKKDTGQVYAMKSLLKNDVIVKQQAAHVKAERDILAEANSSWIVKLYFSFQDERCLYFIMEYVPGGDLMQLLIQKGIFGETLARFYTAELSCAIEYVHSLGFIHRDIKPDNILIDKEGHLKLTDFGLCTGLRWTHDRRYYGPENEDGPSSHMRNDSFSLPPHLAHLEPQMKVLDVRHQKKRNQAHSVVGTGNYMAPEVIRRTGHTQLCDWWSVGVILYEMVFGRPPFLSMSEDPAETQYKIINWPRFLDLSARVGGANLSQECISLIRQLICEEHNRLGMERGAQDIKRHPWFTGLDMKTLRKQRAEYIPRVEHPEDTRNFDTIEISESPFETLTKRAAPNNPAFFEFTFRHFFDYDGQGCPSLRPIKRPSLAPLLENGHMPSSNSTTSATPSFKDNSNHQQTYHSTHPLNSRSQAKIGGLHNVQEDSDSEESFIV